MKKILILCILFLQAHFFSAQKYIPFPSNMISYGYIYHMSADNYYYNNYRAEIHGDTIFHGIHYSKYYLAEKFPDDRYKHPYPNTSGSLQILLEESEMILQQKKYTFII